MSAPSAPPDRDECKRLLEWARPCWPGRRSASEKACVPDPHEPSLARLADRLADQLERALGEIDRLQNYDADAMRRECAELRERVRFLEHELRASRRWSP